MVSRLVFDFSRGVTAPYLNISFINISFVHISFANIVSPALIGFRYLIAEKYGMGL